jgi:hypothetical protein
MEITLFRQNDFWMDNGIENFYTMLSSISKTEDCVDCDLNDERLVIKIKNQTKLLKLIKDSILRKRDGVIFVNVKDKKGITRNILPKYILMQYGKNVKGKNIVKEKLYDNNEIDNRLNKIFSGIHAGDRKCILCGANYSKSVDKMKQSVYPLATRNLALSGVREKRDYYDSICPFCYMIGCLEWADEGLVYRCGLEDQSIVLFPVGTSLLELANFKKHCRQILVERDLTSNIRTAKQKVDDAYGAGEYSSLLLFLEKFLIRVARAKEKYTDFKISQKIWNKWIVLRVPSGIVKDVKFNRLHISAEIINAILNFMKWKKDVKVNVIEEQSVYSSIISKFFVKTTEKKKLSFDERNKLNRTIRENLSKYFIIDDLHSFSSTFLPKKGIYITGRWNKLENLMASWKLGQLGITTDDLTTLKKSANLIAESCINNIGLLYKFDKAQTIGDLLGATREAARKMVVVIGDNKDLKVSPTSLDGIVQLLTSRENQWKELRDLLVIFICMYYTIKKSGKEFE